MTCFSAEPNAAQMPPKASAVPFDFQGRKIGDPPTKPFEPTQPWKEHSPYRYTWEIIKVGGKIVRVMLTFSESKLIGITMLFDSDDFEKIVQAYTAKFGAPPHSYHEQRVVTHLGVEYTNIIVEWNTDSGCFTIKKYGRSAEKGAAVLISPQFLEQEKRRQQSEGAELKGKL